MRKNNWITLKKSVVNRGRVTPVERCVINDDEVMQTPSLITQDSSKERKFAGEFTGIARKATKLFYLGESEEGVNV